VSRIPSARIKGKKAGLNADNHPRTHSCVTSPVRQTSRRGTHSRVVAPQLLSSVGVNGENIYAFREIHDAINNERCSFEVRGRRVAGMEGPGAAELGDILSIEFLQWGK